MRGPRTIADRVAAVAAGVLLAAVAAAGVSSTVAGAAAAPGAKPTAERLGASCSVVWGEPYYLPGHADFWILVTDSPEFPYEAPSFTNIAHASGEAVFTPSGQFNVTCHDNGWASPRPTHTVVDSGTCWTMRSRTPPAKTYSGEAHLRITAAGDVSITCHGSFTGLWPPAG